MEIDMKTIPNFPNYSITKDGQVWSNCYKRWLKPSKNIQGYLYVGLTINKKQHQCRVHRLVLETYVSPCPQGMQCRHLNGNKQDNRLENLKWGTGSENAQDAVRHGTHNWLKHNRTHSPGQKLNTIEKEMIFYARYYNTCTTQELADTYYVSPKTIEKIVRDFKAKGDFITYRGEWLSETNPIKI